MISKFIGLAISFIESPVALFSGFFILVLIFKNQISLFLKSRWGNVGEKIFSILFLAVPVVYIGVAGYYLFTNIVLDQVAPSILSVSWIVARGGELYHSFSAPYIYSLLYGPYAFLVGSFFLKLFGPSFFAAKFGSVVATPIAFILLFYTVRKYLSPKNKFLFWGLAAGLLLLFWTYSFEAHTDSLSLLAATLALFGSTIAGAPLAAILFGIGAGFGIDVKITGVLYFLPSLYILYKRYGWKTSASAVTIAGLTAITPFLVFKNINLHNYLAWLANASNHGFETISLTGNVVYFIFLALPFLVFFLNKKQIDERVGGGYIKVLLFSMFCISILAAKAGSGQNHLLPFIPLLIYGYAAYTGTHEKSDFMHYSETPGFLIALPWLLTMLTISLASSARIIRLYSVYPQSAGADISQVVAKYPNTSWNMGYSDTGNPALDSYLPYFRPLLVFKENKYAIDKPALSDLIEGGKEISPALLQTLKICAGTGWLFPKDTEPFGNVLGYGKPIFDSTFDEIFFANFKKIATTTYFDLWACKK